MLREIVTPEFAVVSFVSSHLIKRGGLAVLFTLMSSFSLSTHAALINLGDGGKVATQSTSLSASFPADRAINGSTVGGQSDISHTAVADTAPSWRFDVGSSAQLQTLEIYNRTDCCAGRLRDITVEVLDFNNQVVYTSPLLNPGNSEGGGAGNYAVGPSSPLTLNLGGILGRHVRISRAIEGNASGDQSVLSLSEVRVWADNVAQGASATQTSEFNNGQYPASLATDGILSNFSHTADADTASSLTVNLGNGFFIDSVLLHNRDSCCQNRLSNIQVDFLGSDGTTVVYTSPTLNPGAVLGGPAFLGLDFHEINGSPIVAQYVRVSRLNAVSGDPNSSILSLGEVQVFGVLIPEPHSAVLLLVGGWVLRCCRTRKRQK